MRFSLFPRREILENATPLASVCGTAAEEGVQYQVIGMTSQVTCDPVVLSSHDNDLSTVPRIFSAPPLFCARVPNATVVGKGLVIDTAGTLLKSRLLDIGDDTLGNPRRRSINPNWQPLSETDDSSLRAREISGRVILLASAGEHIWGHWLLDLLPRLFLARMCQIRNAKILIGCETRASGKELLKLAGVSGENLLEYDPATDRVMCEELYVPSLCRVGSSFHPILAPIYGKFVSSLTGSTKRSKLFVSRTNWQTSKRVLVNRREVEARYQDLGFETVYPESMAPLEQVRRFGNASAIAGEAGSGLHNSVFSPSATALAVLMNPNYDGAYLQVGLCAAFGQPTVIVKGREDAPSAFPGFGDYTINTALIQSVDPVES